MKKSKIRIISFLVALACMMSVSAYASDIAPYASDQIGAYDGDAIAVGNGPLAIEFSIEGTGKMSSLGAQRIRVYEDYYSDGWALVKTFKQTDEGMATSGKVSYGNTIYYDGISGMKYKIEITVFATDSKGVTDSRTITCYVTA